jgi:hypothetical protein
MEADPMAGQIAYTSVAIGALTWACLDMFRYRTGIVWEAYEDQAEVIYTTVDYFKWAHYIGGYGNIALWSVAAITQLMSNFGIATDINLMVWIYGVFMGGAVLNGLISSVNFFAMNSAYTY